MITITFSPNRLEHFNELGSASSNKKDYTGQVYRRTHSRKHVSTVKVCSKTRSFNGKGHVRPAGTSINVISHKTTSNLFHNHVHSTLNTTRLHESNDIDCSVFSYVNSSVPLKELDQKLEIIGTGQETQCIANEKDSSYLTTIQNYSCPDNINDKSILSDYQSKTKQVNICVSKGVVKCSDITDNNDIMVHSKLKSELPIDHINMNYLLRMSNFTDWMTENECKRTVRNNNRKHKLIPSSSSDPTRMFKTNTRNGSLNMCPPFLLFNSSTEPISHDKNNSTPSSLFINSTKVIQISESPCEYNVSSVKIPEINARVQEPNSKFLLVLCNEKSATTTAPSIHSNSCHSLFIHKELSSSGSNAYGSTSAKNFSISLSSPPLQTDTCQLAPSSSSLDKQTQQLDKRKKYPLIDIIYSNEEEQLMTSQILHKTLDMNHVLVSTTTSSSSKTFLNRSQELLLTKPLLKRSCASYLIEHSNHIFGTKNYEEQNDDEFFITAGCVLHSCPNIYTSVLGDNEFIRQRSKSCEISCIEYLSDDKSAFVPNSYDTCSNKYTFTPRFQSKQKNDYDSTDSINSEIEDYCIRHQNGFHCSSMVDDNLFPSTWRSDEHLLQIPFYDDSPSVIRSRSYDIQINRRSVLV